MRCNNVRCIIISNACRQKPNSNYTESLQLAKETREFSTQNDDRDIFIFDMIRTETPYEDKLCEINSRVDDNSTLRKQIHRSKKKRGMGRGINQTNKNKKGRTRIKIIKRTRTRTRIRKNKTMKKLRNIKNDKKLK